MNFNQSLLSHKIKLLLLSLISSLYFIIIMVIVLRENIYDNKIYYITVIILALGCITFTALMASRLHKINKLNNYFAREL